MKQIGVKRGALQELYKTVTSKQLQVMRLEKMVKLMEDQQDRAQAQRTRLENRIAQLEQTIQKTKERYIRDILEIRIESFILSCVCISSVSTIFNTSSSECRKRQNLCKITV